MDGVTKPLDAHLKEVDILSKDTIQPIVVPFQNSVQDHTGKDSTVVDNPTELPLNNKLCADSSHADHISGIYCSSLWNRLPAWRVFGQLANGVYGEDVLEQMTYQGKWCGFQSANRNTTEKLCGVHSFGQCKLSAFVESLGFARSGGRGDR
ncbi:hypothetical protein PspLS_11077 [Pyricularia sp. CBS 133598]|nr:hypothetical protein PspLS_11077 [Pyricularia sp. CBS 133598]